MKYKYLFLLLLIFLASCEESDYYMKKTLYNCSNCTQVIENNTIIINNITNQSFFFNTTIEVNNTINQSFFFNSTINQTIYLYNVSWDNVTDKPSTFPANQTTTLPWANITEKPILFSTSWDNVSLKPTQPNTGYGNISGLPTTFPANQTTTLPWGNITEKPTLFSTSWDNVTLKPTLFSTSWINVTLKPTLFLTSWNNISLIPSQPNTGWSNVSGTPQINDTPPLWNRTNTQLVPTNYGDSINISYTTKGLTTSPESRGVFEEHLEYNNSGISLISNQKILQIIGNYNSTGTSAVSMATTGLYIEQRFNNSISSNIMTLSDNNAIEYAREKSLTTNNSAFQDEYKVDSNGVVWSHFAGRVQITNATIGTPDTVTISFPYPMPDTNYVTMVECDYLAGYKGAFPGTLTYDVYTAASKRDISKSTTGITLYPTYTVFAAANNKQVFNASTNNWQAMLAARPMNFTFDASKPSCEWMVQRYG